MIFIPAGTGASTHRNSAIQATCLLTILEIIVSYIRCAEEGERRITAWFKFKRNDKLFYYPSLHYIQQPPLDGSKLALWLYLQRGTEVIPQADRLSSTLVRHNGYEHLWTMGMMTTDGTSYVQTGRLLDVFNLKALILVAVLLILTRGVKQLKKLHPVIFILASAVIGILFGF